MDYITWYLAYYNNLNKLYADYCKYTGEIVSSASFERFAEGIYRETANYINRKQ